MSGENNINFKELGIKPEDLSEKDQILYSENIKKDETKEITQDDTIPVIENTSIPNETEKLNPVESNGSRFLKDLRGILGEILGDFESQKSWMSALADKVKMMEIRARVAITKVAHSEIFKNVMDFCSGNLPNSNAEFVVLFAMIALPIVLERLKNAG